MPQTVHHLQPTPDRFEQIAYHVGRLKVLGAPLDELARDFGPLYIAELAFEQGCQFMAPPTQFG